MRMRAKRRRQSTAWPSSRRRQSTEVPCCAMSNCVGGVTNPVETHPNRVFIRQHTQTWNQETVMPPQRQHFKHITQNNLHKRYFREAKLPENTTRTAQRSCSLYSGLYMAQRTSGNASKRKHTSNRSANKRTNLTNCSQTHMHNMKRFNHHKHHNHFNHD